MAGSRKANGEGTVFQRMDGRWQGAGYVHAADGTRKRVYVYGDTRKQATDKLADKLAASNRGVVVAADPTLTVGDYLDHWLHTVAKPRIRATTFTTYEHLVRRYLIPGLGSRRLGMLTVRDVRTYLDHVRTTCQCCAQGIDARRDPTNRHRQSRPRCCAIGACCNKTVRPATIRYIRGVLSAALADGVRDDILGRNVASAVRLPGTRSTFQPFTAKEASRYLLTAATNRHGPLFELALRTGMRQGEILGLKWTDIDLDRGHLYIQRTLARTKGGPTFQPVKTYRSARRILVPQGCLTSLKRQQWRQNTDQRAAGDTWQDTGLVFTNPRGGPLDPRTVFDNHRAICDMADLRYIRFHDLRHTCASLLLERGVELITIKELLGHAQISTTADIYSHVRVRLQQGAIEAMNAALADSDPDDQPDDEGEPPPTPALR
ncbi:integrase [Catenuloplanes nepalensis]|uniref:Integrase n=1 Tax=Catenuloplanes nepalensis TaxID=587533 RepID=A0ABT9MQK5_9ACTN|nr:site-specific integrase [Catenuloplanes nepalensis]MDP9793715.1 integrase [Catenuloplanes nepalensis]